MSISKIHNSPGMEVNFNGVVVPSHLNGEDVNLNLAQSNALKEFVHERNMDLKHEKYIKPFQLSEECLRRMMEIMQSEIEIGLSKEGHLSKTPLQMENTYLTGLLDGSENGSYLAIDLGGTRFRVHYVQIEDGRVAADTQPYPLGPTIVQGPGEELFKYMAQCLKKFLEDRKLMSICSTLSLGFCFSFPIIQKSLDRGLLWTWTKDFRCSGVEGNDVVAMLSEAIKLEGLEIKIVAILNDSTGTLVAGTHKDPDCCMSVIIGTGSNAAYFEKIENIGMWEGSRHLDEHYSIIDTEWGAFGDNGVIEFLKTPFDKEIDANSKHPGSFSFEKLFSGLYLGELTRVILCHAHLEGLFLHKMRCPKQGDNVKAKPGVIIAKDAFPTKYVSAIEEEYALGRDTKLMEILKQLGLAEYADTEDRRFIQDLCAVLISRAAKLVAASIATILKRMGDERPRCAVAIDGSMYKLVPRIDQQIKHWIAVLLQSKTKVKIFLSEDGSGTGAALVAAIAERMARCKNGAAEHRIGMSGSTSGASP